MRQPAFIGPSYTFQSKNVDCQRTVNLFPEMNDLGTGKEKEVAALVPTPGLRFLVEMAGGAYRGSWTASNGQSFSVGGNKFYRLESDMTLTELGTLNSTTGPVSMADNGLHVVIVDGVDGYTWTIASSTFAEIVDVNFYPASHVAFIDGYFVFNRLGTAQFFISGLYDITFDGADIATAEGSPDSIVSVFTTPQHVALFGSQSVEVYFNSGDADFPFSRIQGAVIPNGCSAGFSVAEIQGTFFWVGGDKTGTGIIYRSEGYKAVRISTGAIEAVIKSRTAAQIAAARGWAYQQGGHLFYLLNIPGLDSTWVFDATTNLWHERTYRNLWAQQRHRAEGHMIAHGLNVVGDYENGNLYALDQDYYSDNGTVISRERAAPHISDGLKLIRHNSFQLDMETGVGLDGVGQGTDPKVMLQYSDDGGHTWSKERVGAAGKIGKTRTRVLWRRLGLSRDRVYRVRITDPVKTVLIGAEIGVEKGLV